MNKTRFLYFRDKDYNPVGCLAFSIDFKSHTVTYGYSVHNPNDQFNRTLGRKVAEGRMHEKPSFFKFEGDKVKLKNLVGDLLLYISKSKDCPNRIRRSVSNMIKRNSAYAEANEWLNKN